jgi:hypothetical protein
MIEQQEPYEAYMRRMTKEVEAMGDIKNHLIALKNKHHNLDKRIEALVAEHAPDEYVIKMKKEKLKIKEEIVKIEENLL